MLKLCKIMEFKIRTNLIEINFKLLNGFLTARAYKYKTKRQAKMKRRQKKTTFFLISHQATLVLEKHRFAHRP